MAGQSGGVLRAAQSGDRRCHGSVGRYGPGTGTAIGARGRHSPAGTGTAMKARSCAGIRQENRHVKGDTEGGRIPGDRRGHHR